MNLIRKLISLFSSHRIDSPERAQTFLESRAAYLVQKSLTEYSQARANMMFSALLGEKSFQEAYEAARWTSYPAGLAMVAEVMAGSFRNRLNISAADASRTVLQLVENIAHSTLGHGPLTMQDWSVELDALSKSLAKAELAQPQAAHPIAKMWAQKIFDALPFHPSIKQHDFDMFRNTLTFHLTGIATELEEATLTPDAVEYRKKPAA